jgi:hypothetical protein
MLAKHEFREENNLFPLWQGAAGRARKVVSVALIWLLVRINQARASWSAAQATASESRPFFSVILRRCE